jgi:hypothetical protein
MSELSSGGLRAGGAFGPQAGGKPNRYDRHDKSKRCKDHDAARELEAAWLLWRWLSERLWRWLSERLWRIVVGVGEAVGRRIAEIRRQRGFGRLPCLGGQDRLGQQVAHFSSPLAVASAGRPRRVDLAAPLDFAEGCLASFLVVFAPRLFGSIEPKGHLRQRPGKFVVVLQELSERRSEGMERRRLVGRTAKDRQRSKLADPVGINVPETGDDDLLKLGFKRRCLRGTHLQAILPGVDLGLRRDWSRTPPWAKHRLTHGRDVWPLKSTIGRSRHDSI